MRMIKSFIDKGTEKMNNKVFPKELPHNTQWVALCKLIMLTMQDVRTFESPPTDRLEALHGKQEEQ